jgi:predicted GH43/DUF377 family glycosyl hydrolase
MKKLFMMFCLLLVMVSGCASMETRVDQTVGSPQVKIGSYNIDISDDYKYLGNIPTDFMAKDGENMTTSETNVKIENHVFVKGVSVSESILVRVFSLEKQWHYRSEVDFDNLIKKGVVQHGRKNNMPYVIQKFNRNDKMFLKMAKFASDKGHIFNDKQYVYIMRQGRNSGRNKRFFVNYLRGFENLPTEAGVETYQSANRAFTITAGSATPAKQPRSEFGQVWQKYSENPLVSAIGAPGSWHGSPPRYIIVEGHALWDGTEYKGYFGGTNGRTYSIGLVASPNLESGWTAYSGNPVLTAGAFGEWDQNHVGNPIVIKDEDIYKMWYAGTGGDGIEQIGYATSKDGFTWTKYAHNPVLKPNYKTWEEGGVFGPYVIKEEDTYKMWYSGWVEPVAGGIGYAISQDGINWIKSSENPVLESGASDSWDQAIVACPVVIHDEGRYLMWYLGEASFIFPTALPQTGFAVSDDGIHWTKDSTNNPILRVEAGKWDSGLAGVAQVFKEGSTYKMLYGGTDLETFFGMGLATLKVSNISSIHRVKKNNLSKSLTESASDTQVSAISHAKKHEKEPWTGIWRVEGSTSAQGPWGMKQKGKKVISTKDSLWELKGNIKGNQLKGQLIASTRVILRFIVNISSDGQSFEGNIDDWWGTVQIKGKRVE